MAKFFTDFDVGYDSSQWTQREASQTLSVITDAGAVGGKTLRHGGTTANDSKMLIWNIENSDPNMEIFCRMKTSTKNYNIWVNGRVNYNSGDSTYTSYLINLRPDLSQWHVYVRSPTFTKISTDQSLTIGTNTFYDMLLRVRDDKIQAKVWLSSHSEPSSWTVDLTNTVITSGGQVAIGFYGPAGLSYRNWDVLGVGTGYDLAPRTREQYSRSSFAHVL